MQTLEQLSVVCQTAALVQMRMVEYRAERNRRESYDPEAQSVAEADKAMCALLMHTLEELTELLMCLNRKSWKPVPSIRGDSPESKTIRQQALAELADVYLMLDAFQDTAGMSRLEVLTSIDEKMQYNLRRKDHSCNVAEAVIVQPDLVKWLDNDPNSYVIDLATA